MKEIVEDVESLFDREPDKYVQIDPVGYTANLRLVVRNKGLLAVVADFSTGWDSRVGARNHMTDVLPPLNSIYVHYWTADNFEHTPCDYTSMNHTDGCKMSLWLDTKVNKGLGYVLVSKGSEKALEYLKQHVYLPEVNGEQ